LIRLLGPRRLAAVMLRTNAGGGPPMAPAQGEQFVAMLGSNRKANMLAAARDLNTFDSRPHLKTVQAPTLVVAGETDQAVPMAHARMLADLIPNATLRVVAGAGHTLMWTHPAVLAEIIEPWLAS
jgi:pimeloyl-ACP methyl ester carboxylesterase